MKLKSIDHIIAERDAFIQEKPTIKNASKYIFHKVEIEDELRLYRIKAVRDIPKYSVKAGDLGGLVQTPLNLSQDGDCWVGYDAKIIGNARVSGDAQIITGSRIKDNAIIDGKVCISESVINDRVTISGNVKIINSVIYNDVIIKNAKKIKDCHIYEKVSISGKVTINNSRCYANANLSGNVSIDDSGIFGGIISKNAVIKKSRIFDCATISDNAFIINSCIKDNSNVSEKAYITDSIILDSSIISGNAIIANNATIKGNSIIDGDVQLACPVTIKDCTLHNKNDITVLPNVPLIYFNKTESSKLESISVLSDKDYYDRSWVMAYETIVGNVKINYFTFNPYYCNLCGVINNKTNELYIDIVKFADVSMEFSNIIYPRRRRSNYSPCTENGSLVTIEDCIDKQNLSSCQRLQISESIDYIKEKYKNELIKTDTYYGVKLNDNNFVWKCGQDLEREFNRCEIDNFNLSVIASFKGKIDELNSWLYSRLDIKERDYTLSTDYYMNIIKEHVK